MSYDETATLEVNKTVDQLRAELADARVAIRYWRYLAKLRDDDMAEMMGLAIGEHATICLQRDDWERQWFAARAATARVQAWARRWKAAAKWYRKGVQELADAWGKMSCERDDVRDRLAAVTKERDAARVAYSELLDHMRKLTDALSDKEGLACLMNIARAALFTPTRADGEGER